MKPYKEWGEGHRAGLSLGKYELEGGSSLENTTIYNAGANVCYPLFADMGGPGSGMGLLTFETEEDIALAIQERLKR